MTAVIRLPLGSCWPGLWALRIAFAPGGGIGRRRDWDRPDAAPGATAALLEAAPLGGAGCWNDDSRFIRSMPAERLLNIPTGQLVRGQALPWSWFHQAIWRGPVHSGARHQACRSGGSGPWVEDPIEVHLPAGRGWICGGWWG